MSAPRRALAGLADRAPLPVEIEATPTERLPDAVESASYFVVAEALTNVAHAWATRATVNVTRTDGEVLVEISDDGVGGADPARSGLRGLVDRVSALGGTLEIDRGPGTARPSGRRSPPSSRWRDAGASLVQCSGARPPAMLASAAPNSALVAERQPAGITCVLQRAMSSP